MEKLQTLYLTHKKVADRINGLIDKSATGWGSYSDDEYTESSTLVITAGNGAVLTNNAASIFAPNLPLDVETLWVDDKIKGVGLNDGCLIRIDFQAYTTSNTGYGEIHLDIGGDQGVILEVPVDFPRGTGLPNVRSFSETVFYYTSSTFLANGGTLIYNSIRGTTSIYDITFVISIVNPA